MLNKAAINKMLEMPDDRLLAMLKIILSGTGMDLGGKKIDEKTVRRIRALLSEITDEDIGRFTELAERYKNGG